MTSFEEIYDLFMVTSVSDYRLNNLYKNDKEAFYDFLRGFLTKSAFKYSDELIHKLDFISQEEPIETEEESEQTENESEQNENEIETEEETVIRYYFVNDLLPLEKTILVDSMVIHWYEKNTEDILEISSRLGTKDARENNNRSNLKEKNIRIRELYSALYADIRNLQLQNLDMLEGW